jgi:hypothetical protein
LEDPYARVDVIPSHLVYPEFGGPTGVDRKKLRRVIIVTPVYKEATTQASASNSRLRSSMGHDSDLEIRSEEWISPVYDDAGNVSEPAKVQYYIDGKPQGDPEVNPLGEIPLVHIPNYPLSGEFYGISDLVDIMGLNRELNEKFTDISDIINYHASPITCIVGAKLKDLEKGANRVWGFPTGATVTNLTLTGDLQAAVTHREAIKGAILEMTSTPSHALGTAFPMSNTTGVALQMLYAPMMERRNLKVLTYGFGLRLINRLILKTKEIADPAFKVKLDGVGNNRYRNDIVFPDPMPQDEINALEKSRLKLDMRLTSRRLEILNMGLSSGEVDLLLKEIDKEQSDDAEALFNNSMQEPKSGFGPGEGQIVRGGSNITRGMKIDQDLLKKG